MPMMKFPTACSPKTHTKPEPWYKLTIVFPITNFEKLVINKKREEKLTIPINECDTMPDRIMIEETRSMKEDGV